jgi:hypothetical protein
VAESGGKFIDESLSAAANLDTHQYRAVRLSAGNTVNVTSQSGEYVFGVLQNKPQSGEGAEVRIVGMTKAIAGASVTAGKKVMSNATGFFIDATSGQYVAGSAVTGVASGGIFNLVFRPAWAGTDAL